MTPPSVRCQVPAGEGIDDAVAPFKPMGQLTTLAELHAIKAEYSKDAGMRAAEYEEMNALLDRA